MKYNLNKVYGPPGVPDRGIKNNQISTVHIAVTERQEGIFYPTDVSFNMLSLGYYYLSALD